jgi:uncharacterized protein (DUF2235 family)
MQRNVIVMFDGTWNHAKNKTNVLRMRESIDSSGEHDLTQPCCYVSGVGTHWDNWLSGGVFGRALSQDLQAGYAWLAQTFIPGDQVYVFGFSRGAYSARSLVGLIRKCGLLNAVDESRIAAAYALYRDRTVSPEDPKAAGFRAAHSREIRIRFIGVWDTVGTLGVPLSGAPFSSGYYRWHDTRLSKIVDYAYHAVATDEHRRDYRPAVWTAAKPENREVEQRWFIGAHANVGGGYDKTPEDGLAKTALRWIQDKSAASGLKLRFKAEVGPEHCMAEINDSFREFAFGFYRWFNKRYQRPFGEGVNEKVDPSVWLRWSKSRNYRPGSLTRHPDSRDYSQGISEA